MRDLRSRHRQTLFIIVSLSEENVECLTVTKLFFRRNVNRNGAYRGISVQPKFETQKGKRNAQSHRDGGMDDGMDGGGWSDGRCRDASPQQQQPFARTQPEEPTFPLLSALLRVSDCSDGQSRLAALLSRVPSVGVGVSARAAPRASPLRVAHLEPTGPTHFVCHQVVMEMPNRRLPGVRGQMSDKVRISSPEEARRRQVLRVSYNTKH